MLVACKDREVCQTQGCEHHNPHEQHRVATTCDTGACSYAHPDKVVTTFCVKYKEKEPTWVL
jgi:hypothetical protein